MPPSLISISGLVKEHGALRPLRIRRLDVGPAEIVVLSCPDRAAAEALANLIMGALLPDEGNIEVFGESTAAIPDAASWLRLVDRIGLVSDRVVLLDRMTVAQNLAVPFTLDLDPLTATVAGAVAALSREVGVGERELSSRLDDTGPAVRLRVRVARALALDPGLIILEHPTAALPRGTTGFGALIRDIALARGAGVLALTSDRAFAGEVGGRILSLHSATGNVVPGTWRRRLFG